MPRIAEVALFTEDVARLVEFYERLPGRAPDSSSESHASFDLGRDDPVHPCSGRGRSAYLHDPDGRAVELQSES